MDEKIKVFKFQYSASEEVIEKEINNWLENKLSIEIVQRNVTEYGQDSHTMITLFYLPKKQTS